MGVDYSAIRIKTDQARKIVNDLFQVEGEATALHGEFDFNFKIKTTSESYILKISRPEEEVSYIEFQQALLNFIANGQEKIEAPKTIPDRDDNLVSEIIDANGNPRKVRLLSWMEGRLWSLVNPIKDELLYSLGEQAGKLTNVLQGFDHPEAHREFDWDLAQAEWTYDYVHLFTEEQQKIARYFQDQYKAFQVEYQKLRKAVVHNDTNDNNVIVTYDLINPQVRAIIDYGDAVYTQIINDLAIATAYAVMHKPDALAAALPIVKGYNSQFPLQEEELKFLYHLIAMRLIISVCKAAINKQKEPDNEYLWISEKPAWDVLQKWAETDGNFAHYSFREACGYNAHPNETEFKNQTKKKNIKFSSLFPTIGKENIYPLDLSVSSTWIGVQSEFNDLDLFQFKINQLQARVPDKIIAGGYLEPRPIYTTSSYDKIGNNGNESRSIHLGIDFLLPAQTPVHSIFDGVIVTAVNDEGDKEYGGLIIIKHRFNELDFFTLYGHLTIASVKGKEIGQTINKGDRIGHLGDYPENGNWAPHLHFQILLSTLDYNSDFPGVTYPGQMNVWKSICPNPNLFFKDENLESQVPNEEMDIISYRKNHLGKSLSLSYDKPLKIVRGAGVYLIDDYGRKYLDTVNNVAHVGHEHPRVVKAGQEQMATLNTNTRYLHKNINDFAKELLSTFHKELSVVHFVNSGSEANELALRMAQAFTGQKDMIAVEMGYHGNTKGCIDISSYKFDGKGGKGAPEYTHIVPLPDTYRGIYQGQNTGPKYARHIQEQIDNIQAKGRNVAGFICESIISCGGQVELPKDYLKLTYESVRSAGGLCIADEVQTGCGRMGSHFWGFQLHEVVPDIVTIGKPIGNGHPLAAVVCSQKVASAFANGMEYFNTFGGNPVSTAIGKEVLHVIKEEKLQENALKVGSYLKEGFRKLQGYFPIIGDIRGQGLFLGFELTGLNKKPLADKASYLVNRMKDYGILMSTDGKDNNAIKVKPPMVFSLVNADELLARLKMVFAEDFMKQE